MSTAPPAQIILSTSRSFGLVAIACGTQYSRARRALDETGFQQIPGGASASPLTDGLTARQTASTLVHRAHEHGVTLTTSTRPYLGDIGHQIAAQLPGAWSSHPEIYSHPAWQEDLVPLLWDRGDLIHSVEHQRVPYATVLRNDTGTHLLLIERPGHSSEYVVGAFGPDGFDDNYEQAHAPRSVVLPAATDLAARAIHETFLPAYHRAVHHRRLDTVLSALEHIREEHLAWRAIKESGRSSDGMPLTGSRLLPELDGAFAEHAGLAFRNVLEHAPALLSRCRPALTPWPQDAAALDRLRAALTQIQETTAPDRALSSIPPPTTTGELAPGRSGVSALPVIETWLADSEAFERQARAAAPGGPVALAAPSPRALTARPAPPTMPGSSTKNR
ncbi:hypothetical protein [Streptomyces sp. MNP-20]|uniref:hypothetical protein n=1 Tax=Streptomyces sp. MNP-20 TaxID=2721165 RepID=UPI0015559539|nr:hypothetical protein [Streptomyces sp. MNP-20]